MSDAVKARPTRIAENVDKTPHYIEPLEQSERPNVDDFWCLKPDGSIDNKAQTNKTAREVADIMGCEISTTDPLFCAGIVLLLGKPLRYNFGPISDFTGLPLLFCKRVVMNLVRSKLILKREISGDLSEEIKKPVSEQDQTSGTILFVMYCGVGAGQFTAKLDRKTGIYTYGLPLDKDKHFCDAGRFLAVAA